MPDLHRIRNRYAHRNRRQARFQGRSHPAEAVDPQHAQRRGRQPRLPLPAHGHGVERISAHRREHGRDRHHGDGARARQARRADRAAQTLSRSRARRILCRARRRARFLFARHDRGGPQEARRGCEDHADPLPLPRRRQRLRRKIPRNRQAGARRPSGGRHHGRQCRHRRHDRGPDPGRRRHRQDRHRPRLGLHHAARDRRRLSAAFGDHRMRRRGAWAQGSGLRRRRLHGPGRRREGLWRGRRFRHAGRHAGRPRRMRRRDPLRGARRGEGRGRHVVLRHVVGDCDEEAFRRRRPLPRR